MKPERRNPFKIQISLADEGIIAIPPPIPCDSCVYGTLLMCPEAPDLRVTMNRNPAEPNKWIAVDNLITGTPEYIDMAISYCPSYIEDPRFKDRNQD